MALPKRNKARAAFVVGAMTTCAYLGMMGAGMASAGTNDYEWVMPHGERMGFPTSWTKMACIDHPEIGQRECGAFVYLNPVGPEVLPHYNRGTDHIDMPPEGGEHWMVKLGGGGWINLP